MKKIKITTPENIEVEYTLADLGSRTAAALIDMLIQSIVFIVLIIANVIILNYSSEFWEKNYGWIIGISILIYTIISYSYFIVMELRMNGMTIGKKIMKLRTIRNNGQPITAKHSAIRNLFRIFLDYYGFGVVFIFFSKERKRIGDYAASTIVISEIDKSRPITLESLQKDNEHIHYYINDEEYELLRDYIERKQTMKDYTILREELKRYFTRKFEAAGTLDEWQSFIDEI